MISLIDWLGTNALYGVVFGYMGFIGGFIFGSLMMYILYTCVILICGVIEDHNTRRKLAYFTPQFLKDYAILKGKTLRELKGGPKIDLSAFKSKK